MNPPNPATNPHPGYPAYSMNPSNPATNPQPGYPAYSMNPPIPAPNPQTGYSATILGPQVPAPAQASSSDRQGSRVPAYGSAAPYQDPLRLTALYRPRHEGGESIENRTESELQSSRLPMISICHRAGERVRNRPPCNGSTLTPTAAHIENGQINNIHQVNRVYRQLNNIHQVNRVYRLFQLSKHRRHSGIVPVPHSQWVWTVAGILLSGQLKPKNLLSPQVGVCAKHVTTAIFF